WVAEGRQLVTERSSVRATTYPVPKKANAAIRAKRPEVEKALKATKTALVDVRSTPEFVGEIIAPPGMTETAQRAGHIPGAKNVPWSKAVATDGTFKPFEELLQLYKGAKVIDGKDEVIAYCRIGERSSHTWFALKYLLGVKKVLESSSGNTAIAYAMLGAAAGIGVTVCVPANASAERKALLETYGAEVIFTDPLDGSDGAIRAARDLAAAQPHRYWYADQYNHPANARAHYLTTAEEIWRQTGGRVTHLVAGLGTTGTLVGTGRRLKELNAGIELVAVQPDGPFHGLEGLKH